MPILLAGFGKQGGTLKSLKDLLNKKGRGVFVNSSRKILYNYSKYDNDWEIKINNSVINIKNLINRIRNERS